MNATGDISTISRKPKLLNQVRQALRMRHYSYHTEEAYINWITQYILDSAIFLSIEILFSYIRNKRLLDEAANYYVVRLNVSYLRSYPVATPWRFVQESYALWGHR